MSNSKLHTILSARFSEYDSTPSAGVWSALEAELDKDNRRKKGIWIWFADGLAAASIIGFIVYALGTGSDKLNVHSEGFADKVESTNEQTNKTEESNKITPQQTLPIDVKNNLRANLSGSTIKDEPNERQEEITVIETIQNNELQRSVEDKIIYAELLSIAQIDNGLTNEITNNSFHLDEKTTSQWEVGFNVIGFVNSTSNAPYTNSLSMAPAPPTADPALLGNNGANHTRYIELNGFVQKKIRRRLGIGIGLAASIAQSDYSEIVSNDTLAIYSEFDRNYWSIGTPVHANFDFIQKGRWSFNLGMIVQPEVRFVSRSISYASSEPTVGSFVAENSVFESQENDEFKRFHLGIQPTVGVDFVLMPRMKVSLKAGYRTYLFRNAYLRTKGVEPNYITASAGIAWMLK